MVNLSRPLPDKLSIPISHLESASTLIAMTVSSYSTLVLVSAAEEMVRHYAKANSLELRFDMEHWFTAKDPKSTWRNIREPYNFMKHSDRDANSAYSGPSGDELLALISFMYCATCFNLLGFGFELSRQIRLTCLRLQLDFDRARPWVMSGGVDPMLQPSLDLTNYYLRYDTLALAAFLEVRTEMKFRLLEVALEGPALLSEVSEVSEGSGQFVPTAAVKNL